MSLLTQLRQDSASFIADAASPLPLDASPVAAAGPATPASVTAYVVSPPEEWSLPEADWLPPVMRGLPVFLPADDWWIPTEAPWAPSTPASAVAETMPGEGLCCTCGCPLFWQPIGDDVDPICVECSPPPIKRMVEDLWLAIDGVQMKRVSDDPKWLRAAFAHLKPAEDQRRAEAAVKAAKENEGF